MSSILKALRKIEEQKGNGSGPRPDIMQDEGRAGGRSNPYLPLLGGACLGVVLVLVIYLLVGGERPVAQSPAAPPAAVSVSPTETTPVAPAPAVHLPDSTTPVAAAPVVAEPINAEPVKAVPQTVGSSAPAPAPEKAAAALVKEETLHNPLTTQPIVKQVVVEPVKKELKPVPSVALEEEVQEAVTVEPTDSKSAPSVPAVDVDAPIDEGEEVTIQAEELAEAAEENLQRSAVSAVDSAMTSRSLPEGVTLVVGEVYPQTDSSSSMAVVNDLPVMIGTTVGSAVVEDISDDGVVFVIEGERYAVPTVHIVPDAGLIPGGD